MGSRSLVVFTRALALVPVLALALATSNCGSDSPAGTASCTISQMVGTISQKLCEEGMNLSSAQVQQLMQECMVSGGFGADAGISQQASFAYAACSHDGALGGCRVVQGGMTVVAWYYDMPGFTSADIQQLCAGVGATFVSP